jgi:predicted O-methyltransferase YrrM
MVAAHFDRVPLNWQKEFGHHLEPVLPVIGSDRDAGVELAIPDVQRTVVLDPELAGQCQREHAMEQKPCSFGPFDQIALKALIERAARPNCVMAEIGCWLGEGSTQVFLSTMPETGKLLCVDTWRGSPNVRQHQEVVSRENVLNSFMAKVEATRGSIEVQGFVSSSASAASLIRDKSLDLVFIDADHSYGAVRQDILAWMPKVKSGGIICGHDCEVRPIPQLRDRLWSAKDDDVIDGTGTTFPVIHPGPILAVHETLQGKANLCADDVMTVNGGQGRSSIWWKRVSHYPDDFDDGSLDAGS